MCSLSPSYVHVQIRTTWCIQGSISSRICRNLCALAHLCRLIKRLLSIMGTACHGSATVSPNGVRQDSSPYRSPFLLSELIRSSVASKQESCPMAFSSAFAGGDRIIPLIPCPDC